uniref:Uncharacterized protein n=1 Tax=Anguilla anguilla TaxID=7936 RepID=A0A0E9QI74_ANGAN
MNSSTQWIGYNGTPRPIRGAQVSGEKYFQALCLYHCSKSGQQEGLILCHTINGHTQTYSKDSSYKMYNRCSSVRLWVNN